jgi:2'-5' RNA ligase
MADQEEKAKRVRLFVALDLPERVRAGIAEWGRRNLRDPALRAVREDSLHITLAFLGSRDPAEVEAVAAVVAECGGPAPRIELRDAEPRPQRGRARVYALPALSEGTEQLQARLQDRLVAAGLHEAQERPFWPHVTVARVRAEGAGSRRPAPVQLPPKALPQELLQPFEGVRLVFYRSELQPRGARYVPLAQVELPSQGGSEVI